MMPPLVQVKKLRKLFGSVRALDSVSFDVEAGEWIAIMGPSGSGKTTLINILGGLDHATSGSVIVDEMDISNLGERDLTRYRSNKIGFVFQQFHLVPYLTALENVMLAQYFHSITDESEAAEALRRVGLGDRLTHLPSQLSGGEQQRVAIARALINNPKVILADEPTGNLDEANEAVILSLLHQLHAAGHTILVVTHSQVIGDLADRRIELEHGRLARIVTPSLEEEEDFDHMLEQVWNCQEQGVIATLDKLHSNGGTDVTKVLSQMAALTMLEIHDSEVRLTEPGAQRARDIVRRHRLAERLLTDTFSLDTPAAHSEACKFEHIISPDLDQKICMFLNHPRTCPHGKPIPRGQCCPLR
jgi:putative ABC transport system ATP-binding protein